MFSNVINYNVTFTMNMRITNFPKGLYDELCILYQMTKGGSQASLVF